MNETNSKKSLAEPWFWPKMLFLVKSVLIKIDSEINKKCIFTISDMADQILVLVFIFKKPLVKFLY